MKNSQNNCDLVLGIAGGSRKQQTLEVCLSISGYFAQKYFKRPTLFDDITFPWDLLISSYCFAVNLSKYFQVQVEQSGALYKNS